MSETEKDTGPERYSHVSIPHRLAALLAKHSTDSPEPAGIARGTKLTREEAEEAMEAYLAEGLGGKHGAQALEEIPDEQVMKGWELLRMRTREEVVRWLMDEG